MQQLIIKQLSLIVRKLLKEFDISDSDYKIRLQENKDKEHGKDDANRSAKVDGDDERCELRIWFRFGQRGRRDTP